MKHLGIKRGRSVEKTKQTKTSDHANLRPDLRFASRESRNTKKGAGATPKNPPGSSGLPRVSEICTKRISKSLAQMKRGEKCNCEKQEQNCKRPLYTTAANSESSQACFVEQVGQHQRFW